MRTVCPLLLWSTVGKRKQPLAIRVQELFAQIPREKRNLIAPTDRRPLYEHMVQIVQTGVEVGSYKKAQLTCWTFRGRLAIYLHAQLDVGLPWLRSFSVIATCSCSKVYSARVYMRSMSSECGGCEALPFWEYFCLLALTAFCRPVTMTTSLNY